MEQKFLNAGLRSSTRQENFAHYFAIAFICLIAIAVFVRHLLILDRGMDFIVSQVTIDDTYYYLKTAWNQKKLGFTTFDGVNQTNGVQFLWYWILVGFSYFFPTSESFFYGSLILCGVFSIVSIFLAFRLGQVFEMGWKSIIPAIGIAALAGYNKTLIVGLENSVQLVLFLLMTIQYCKFLTNTAESKLSSRRYLFITCLLGLITWARLDNAPISAILFIHTTIEFCRVNRNYHRFYMGKVVFSSIIIALSAFIMFYGFYLMGGSIMPVSGLWKLRSPEEQNLAGVFAEAWEDGLQRVFPLEHILSERIREIFALLLTFGFLCMLFVRYRSSLDIKKPLLRGLLLLILATVLHEMMMVYRLPYLTIKRGFWYLSPQYVTIVIIVSMFVHWLPEILAHHKIRVQKNIAAFAAFVIVLNTLVFTIYTNKWYLNHTSYDKFHAQRVEAALWLKRNLPDGTRLGSLNSGELGFFSDRSITNLDGLINSFAYFKFRRNGGGITEFCIEQRIDYFIDYAIPEEIKKNSILIHTFNSEPQLQLLKFAIPSRVNQTRN